MQILWKLYPAYCLKRQQYDNKQQNDFNLNISRYVSTAKPEPKIDLEKVNQKLMDIEQKAAESRAAHNQYLKELGLDPI